MKKPTTLRLVTLPLWINAVDGGESGFVSINPVEVSDVEDYCGWQQPGSKITLKNKKTYLVAGKHEDIVAKLTKVEA